jgi:uncharacterized paraquat-inducible protein A
VSNSDPSAEKIRFACSSCEVKLAVPAKHSGATIKCPKCQTSLAVPTESTIPNTDVAKSRAEWSLARCPECEEVSKIRAENQGIPVACPACKAEMIVAVE